MDALTAYKIEMGRYRIEAQEFEGQLVSGCDLALAKGGYISPSAVVALGIVEVVPEPDAVVMHHLLNEYRAWYVGEPSRLAQAQFANRADAIAWARQQFGPNVKVED